MLIPVDMRDLIKQKMEYNGFPTTQEDSIARISKGIGEYLANNAELSYSWVAQSTSTPPVVDSIISFSTSLSYDDSTISLPSSKSQFFSNVSSFLHSSLSINIPSGFSLSLSFNPSGIISANLTSDLTSFDTAMLSFCTQLISTFKTNYLNPSPITGNRIGVYFGSAVMIAIN